MSQIAINENDLKYGELEETTLAQRLKKAKLLKGLTQEKLALKTGLSRSTMVLIRCFLLFLEIKHSLYLKDTYSGVLFNFVIIISWFIIFRDSNDWIKAFIYVLCIILIIISLYWLSGNYNSIQSYFESPRKNNTLIIKQNYVLNKNYTEFINQSI